MKNSQSRSFNLVWLLLFVSFALYLVDFLIFGHGDDIGAGFLGNLAFLPIYILFVTLMVERSLKQRERLALRQKLNMVIGVFFSEVGMRLLRDFSGFLTSSDEVRQRLLVDANWNAEKFRSAGIYLEKNELLADARKSDLNLLKSFLIEKRQFMLGLMENPNLLEHTEFTDLLWAVFHLIEELEARKSLDHLSHADLDHLSGDIKRIFNLLTREWLQYMRHLKTDYPYLFSLAVRMNPMNPEAKAEFA